MQDQVNLQPSSSLDRDSDAGIWRPDYLDQATWEIDATTQTITLSQTYQDYTQSTWSLQIQAPKDYPVEDMAKLQMECWIQPIDDPTRIQAEITSLRTEEASTNTEQAVEQASQEIEPNLANQVDLAQLGQRPPVVRGGESTPLKAFYVHFDIDPPLAAKKADTWNFQLVGDTILNCTCTTQGGEVRLNVSSPPLRDISVDTLNGNASIKRSGSSRWTLTVSYLSGSPTYSISGDVLVVV